jgi:hypothetical protein
LIAGGIAMKSLLAAIALAAFAAGPALAQHEHGSDANPSIAGTWNMSLQGDHVVPVALVLKQNGKAVTGTIAMPTQRIGQRVDVPLEGEFAEGSLKLSGKVEHAQEPTTIDIAGTLKEDGTMEGSLAMRDHNIAWTAERLRERK